MSEKVKPTTFSKKSYVLLTKPGIMMGNAITLLGGYFLAAKGTLNLALFLASVVGLSCLIGSSCVFNNLIDRVADAKMERTKMRSMALRSIPRKKIITFAVVLFVIGSLLLYWFTNFLALSVALFGFVVYVALYSFMKYTSVQGTLIGSIAGAVPPVVGYTAVKNELDLGAFLLFALLTIWQMPHFYAIAIFRLNDYKAASIPVLPLVKGIFTTKVHSLIYAIIFLGISPLLTIFGYTGKVYLVFSILLSLGWVLISLQGFSKKTKDVLWARKSFKYSLIVITILSLLMMFDYT